MPPLSHPPTPEECHPRGSRYYANRNSPPDTVEAVPQTRTPSTAFDSATLIEKLRSITREAPASTPPAATQTTTINAAAPSSEKVRIRDTVERRMMHIPATPHTHTEQTHANTRHPNASSIAGRSMRNGILKLPATMPQRLKRKISFSPAATVRRIPNISIQNDPELAFSLWYTRDQFRDMKERSELLLELLHHRIVEPYDYDRLEDAYAGSVIQDNDYCSIGLDACYGQGREVAEALQTGGRAAVLLEQQVQHHNRYSCEDLIHAAYTEFAEHAAVIAHHRGQNHAKAAGDWVSQELPVEYVQWLFTNLGHQKALDSMVAESKAV